ncbi:hypothetical protein [Pseudomonas veronii]|uniref:hypothetical protein n=1 Tax=Pseudomonas veronii TaxID=76761 RepID=UPI000625CE68|nr:hypothetical protein [Pseudomonas veronii]
MSNSAIQSIMTLREKQAALRDTVALPTADDWQLLIDDSATKEVLIKRLNAVLVAALEFAKGGGLITWGQIGEKIFPALARIESEYPNSGISDSEGYQTVARFFGVNYSPEIYDFLRYYGARGH